MEKILQFKGISLDRSDQLAEMGELAYCEGAEIKHGALRPAVVNRSLVGRFSGTLLYIHQTNTFTHYICLDGGGLYYYNGDELRHVLNTNAAITLTNLTSASFSSMGNTLIISSPGQGLYYIVWDADVNNYLYLGPKPPMVQLRFRAGAAPAVPEYPQDGVELVLSDKELSNHGSTPSLKESILAFTKVTDISEDMFDTNPVIEFDFVTNSNRGDIIINANSQALFTEKMWALINRTHNHIASKGRFYAPFFVRYCYRMFDGSTYMHSAPVLVGGDVDILPQLFFLNANANVIDDSNPLSSGLKRYGLILFKDGVQRDLYWTVGRSGLLAQHKFQLNGYDLAFRPVDFTLQYCIEDSSIAALKLWKDVIQSVDIFISQPVTQYDDATKITKFSPLSSIYPYDNFYFSEGRDKQFYPLNVMDQDVADMLRSEGKITSSDLSPLDAPTDHGNYMLDLYGVEIPRMSAKDKGRFAEVSTFFRLKSIALDDLAASSWSDMEIADGVVKNILTRERMVDEYKSHNVLIPSGMYQYNRRLHLFGLYESLFGGFSFPSMVTAVTVSGTRYPQGTNLTNITVRSAAVEILTDAGAKWVMNNGGCVVADHILRRVPLYYPDSRAVRMVLAVDGGYISFSMDEHPELNGAVTDPDSYSLSSSNPYKTTTNVVPVTESMYVSEAANPFVFPASNASIIGNGRVLGLCAATRALSQGQFGSFPLIAFCSDGIWALSVASDGSYSAVNPISREVCAYRSASYRNGMVVHEIAKSIVQLDQSIMFTTDRGLCQLIGSEVVPVSDILKGRPYDLYSCLGMIPVLDRLSSLFPALRMAKDSPLSDVPLINGNTAVSVLYDYVSHRLMIFPEGFSSSVGGQTPCLLFSESDKQFTTISLPPVRAVFNTYPYAHIQFWGGDCYSLDRGTDFEDTTEYNILLATRFMSFGGFRDVIQSLRHHHNGSKAPLVIVFGSNDGVRDDLIGYTGLSHVDYLPGRPYRYFRIVMAMSMHQYSQYSALILGLQQKHSKL